MGLRDRAIEKVFCTALRPERRKKTHIDNDVSTSEWKQNDNAPER